MQGADPVRLIETVALLPALHVAPGRLRVAAAGPLAEPMVLEALRWRDACEAHLLGAPAWRDRRVRVHRSLPSRVADLMLLSPDQDPRSWYAALDQDGILCASTTDPSQWSTLRLAVQTELGNATPWRNWLPQPLYGVVARNGRDKAMRQRQPPANSRHLSAQYLPVLFTLSKDEIALAFTRGLDTLNRQGPPHGQLPAVPG